MNDGNETAPRAPSSGFSSPHLGLCLVHPPGLAGRTLPLRDGLVIGRDGAVDEVVPDATVSRRHASFAARASGYWVSDLGSRNGTRVNGVSVQAAVHVPEQGVVRFGDVLAVLQELGSERFDAHPELPGTGSRMARARDTLYRAAPQRGTVLISGETGAGKERFAAEVHRLSGRQGPYVTVNCAELSHQLFESQLFGHVRGAFTGASTAHPGLFAAADTGTLFLDEVGEIPMDLQAKLLRALELGEIRAIGSTQTRVVDVRVVAATNQDLPALVEQGRFRRDLLARLATWEIVVPPLRHRRQDIVPWLRYFCSCSGDDRLAREGISFHPDALERVLVHPWLDNLRGLRRLVQRLGGSASELIGLRALCEALPELAREERESAAPPSPSPTRSTAPPEAEIAKPSREELLAVFTALGGSVRATSKHFGRDRRQIYRWLESFGIPRSGDD